jgi:hypothetical protein
MLRIRYLIVDHPSSSDGLLHFAHGKFQHVPPTHDLTPVHHWARFDASTIFVKATYYDRQHKILMAMPNVTVLPSTFSRQTVAEAIAKQRTLHHGVALKNHPLIPFDDATVTSDLVDWFAEYENSIYDHEV